MGYRTWIYKGAWIFGLLSPMSHNAYAVKADYMLGAQAEYTDNITLVETNTQDETTLSLLGGFLVDHSAAALDVNARGLLDYRNYLENTYDDQPLGSLNAQMEWRPRPGALHWIAQDYFTQTALNSAAPQTPDNLVNANAFSTGPDIIFRLAPATTLATHLRRSEYYFENSSTSDNSRNAISAGWIRAIRPQFSLSANVAYEDAQYSEQSQNDFTRLDYFMRADTRRGRSNMVADLGMSNIDRNTGDDVSGFLGRLSLGRQIRTNTRLDLDMSGQYTDSGMDLLTAGAAPFAFNRTGGQISGDVFFDQRMEARYHSGTPGSNWDVYLIARDENYEILPQDRKTTGLRLQVHRGVSGSLYLNGYGQYRREEYPELDQTNKDTEFGLGLEQRLARRISARLDYMINARDSNTTGMDYDKNRIIFLIYYGSNPQQFR